MGFVILSCVARSIAGNELEGERESKIRDDGFGTSSLKSSRGEKEEGKNAMLVRPGGQKGKGARRLSQGVATWDVGDVRKPSHTPQMRKIGWCWVASCVLVG